MIRTLGLAIWALAPWAGHAAEVSVEDITVLVGTPSVAVPLLISPSSATEMIGAMNISFSAGESSDAIPILNTGTEFDGSIWANGGTFFGSAQTPQTQLVTSGVTMIAPREVRPEGTLITYTLDTSTLPVGEYLLNPDHQEFGIGSSAADGSAAVIDLDFMIGMLRIREMQILIGDYSGNGAVEQADLDLVLLNWGRDVVPATWINQLPVGNVDQAELDGVLLNWGKTANSTLGAAGVPEPSTLLLAVMLAACSLLSRRRRCTR